MRAKLMTPKERMKDSHVIEFNREAEVQMEGEKKVNMIYRQIESGVMTRNEARSLLNMPKIADPEQGGDSYYHPANWVVAGDEDDAMESARGMPDTPSTDDGSVDDQNEMESKAANILRAMITSSVTEAVKIEKSRVVQRAGMQADNFTAAINDFYETWTENTAPGLTDSAARVCVISHAEASKRLLMDVYSVSTSSSLKSNVQDVVASWDKRAESLISDLMKAVQ